MFDDGRAHFYSYTTSIGREIRLFVMRSSDGVIRAAFDACDVCYREREGYYQADDTMVCVNCGRRFQSTNINVISGGCNPAPIQRTVEGNRVVLKASDLERRLVGIGSGASRACSQLGCGSGISWRFFPPHPRGARTVCFRAPSAAAG